MFNHKKLGLIVFCIVIIIVSSLTIIEADDNNQDRYIVKVAEKNDLDDSLKSNVVEEVRESSKHSRQIAVARIGISQPKKLVIEGVDEETIKEDDAIIYVEPDYLVKSLGNENTWNLEVIGFYTSQIDSIGKDVKIAILDTGSNNKNIISGFDFVNEDNNALDDNGHGTYVSQILKSLDNELPLINTEIYSVKVLNSQGVGYVSDVIEGINWVIDNNIDIVLMSFGGNGNSVFLEEAINNAYSDGILFIAAAGNDGDKIISYPAAYNSVSSVGSINQNLEKSDFSNYGDSLELVAPGENIIIGGRVLKGTSFSVPHVGIVAASLFSENPTMSNKEIRSLLQKSTLDLGAVGKDSIFGYGIPIIQQSQNNVINFTPLDYPNNNVNGFELTEVKEKESPTIFNNTNKFIEFS